MRPRLRVARVIGILEPGGAQLSAFRLTNALRRYGIDTVTFLAGDATPEGHALARAHGIEIESFPRRAGLQWEPSGAFAAWLQPRLAGADLVHGHMFGAWWACAQVIDPDIPLVASEHNTLTWPGEHHAREMRAALRRVDLGFAHGPAAQAYLRALGLPDGRLVPGESAIAGMGSRPLPGLPVPRLVMTARLAPDKGPDVFVEALGRMADPPPVLIAGEGPLRPALERRVAELGLADRVHFVGWQERPGRYIAGASALVVPSREEAFSQSAVLGLALGVPVVGSAVEALPEVLGEGRGILVPPEDPEALARALEEVLAGRLRPDPLATRAYAAHFTPRRIAARYAARYEALAGGAAARWTTFVTVTSSSSSGP
jgi:glycosyltransferase involved in cell wall biosynthesis